MTLLWEAGQTREQRAQRERLGELYVAVSDAYVAGRIRAGVAKPIGGRRQPWYMRDEQPAARNDLARLVRDMGGKVTPPTYEFKKPD